MINSKIFSLLILINFTTQTCSVDSNKLSRLGIVMLRSLPQARLCSQCGNRGARMSLQYEEEVRRNQEEAREKEVQKREEQRRHRQEEELKRENERRQKIEEAINTNSLY